MKAAQNLAMHAHDLAEWRHDHTFDSGNIAGERGTRLVMWITAAMMGVEIAAGWHYNSMALLADGWHMSSHVVAIGLSAFAYAAARRHAHDPRFAFGTWKIEVLGGFASAVFLLLIAALMVWGSAERLLRPEPIHYPEALAVAALGLAVNLGCAFILGSAHHHDPGHGHEHADGHAHGHHGHHHDLNLKSAYLHVIADAATSVAAIAALAGGGDGAATAAADWRASAGQQRAALALLGAVERRAARWRGWRGRPGRGRLVQGGDGLAADEARA